MPAKMPIFMNPAVTPLAHLIRPTTLDEIIGQQHLVGAGMPLRRMAELKKLKSSIIWGPPGIGKTTIVRAIAAVSDSNFVILNATAAKVEDIRSTAKAAKVAIQAGRQTACFIDEIHRLNKAQQDVLLPFVEEGTFVLFGATTEKPKFAVNSTIVSRSNVFEVKPLCMADLVQVIKRVRRYYKDQGRPFRIEDDAARDLLTKCSGDARKLITALEMVVDILMTEGDTITLEMARTAMPDKHVVFDKSGNEHFDLAKCFQSGIQNSDANGVIYWLAKWISSGEDPAYIARRMVVTAWEDCSTNPMAPLLADAALRAVETTGLPECLIPMAYTAITLAQSERNKTAYRAISAAMEDVQNGETVYVPEENRAGNHGDYVSSIKKTYVPVDMVALSARVMRGESNLQD